jgi:dimethylhistidine N-methyltransferase
MSDSPHLSALDHPEADAGLLNEILLGLASEKKTLPSKLLYDAAGSELFQRITELPEYYLTRTEKKLLSARAADIVASVPFEVGRGRALVEFGASDESKAVSLLDAGASHFSAYLAIDISPSVLGPIRTRMQASHPQIKVETLLADFLQPLAIPETLRDMHMVGFLPGSTIGQFSTTVAVQFLDNARRALAGQTRAAFVIGIDQCRDAERLLAAYDDSAGVSSAFHLNILSHVNRLAECDLNLNGFARKVLWNPREERMEMYLESRYAQSARIQGHSIRFAEGETIQTGISYKYGKERFLSIAATAGWSSAGFWEDSERLFAIHLLQASSPLPGARSVI